VVSIYIVHTVSIYFKTKKCSNEYGVV